MKITVTAGPWATRYLKDDFCEIMLPEGSSVQNALEALPIDPREIGLTSIGGQAVQRERVLEDGDCLKIYPVILGG